MRRGNLLTSILGSAVLIAGSGLFSTVHADQPPREEFRERIPIQEPREPMREPVREEGNWNHRLSAGVAVWFFDHEDTEAGPAGFYDVWHDDMPLNFRVGIEGRHLYLSQRNAQSIAEAPGKTPDITFLRIPISVEYALPLQERFTMFFGIGPDIIRVANDTSDWDVGMHLSTRLHYDITEHWGVAVEGGYFWADVDAPGPDIELDSAYVTPMIAYTF